MPPAANAAPGPHAPADLEAVIRRLLAEVVTTGPAELLDLKAVLALTGQGRTSWYRAVSAGDAPASCSTPSGPRWKRSAVLKWIERLKT